MVVKKSRKAEGWLECTRAGDSLEVLIEKWSEEQIRQALREEGLCNKSDNEER